MPESLSFEAVLSAQGFLNGINQMIAGLNNLRSQVASTMSGISGQFSGLKSGLMSALSGGDFSKAGEQLGQAIIGPLSASFGALGGAAANVATALGPVGIAALGAGAAIVGMGVGIASAVNTASSFEKAISGVAAITGESANAAFEFQGRMTTLAEVARQAGATSVFSASQAAAAMKELAAVGMNNQQIAAALPGTMNLAAAGNLDFARATEIVASSLSQFSLKAEEANRVANLYSAVASQSATTVEELGYAMTYVGPVAGSLGLSIEQTSAALGVLANAGFKGSMGGTALRGILSDLVNPTKTTTDTLASLGLTLEDVDPRVHSLADIIDTLKEHGMGGAEAMKIFGERAGPGMLALLSQGSDALRQMEKDITGTNKAAEMAATQTENLWGAQQQFASAVEEAQIALGNLFLPVLTKLTDFGTQVILTFTSVGKTIYDVIANSQAAQALGSMFSAVGGAIQGAFGNISNLLKPAFDALGGGAGAVNALKTAFNAITAPVTAAASGVRLLTQGFQQLVSAASPVTSAIGSALGNAVSQVVEKFERAKATAQALFETIARSSVVQGAMQAAVSQVQALQNVFEQLKSAVQSIWESISSRISESVGGALDAVRSKIDEFVDWLRSTPIGQFFGVAGEAAGGMITGLKERLVSPIEGFISEVRTRADEIYNASRTPGERAAEGLADGISENKELVTNAVTDSVAGPDVVSQAGKAAKEAGRKISKEFASGYEAGLSDMQIIAMINRQTEEAKHAWQRWAGTTVAQEQGITIGFRWWADKRSNYYELYVDGQRMGRVEGMMLGKEDALRELLEQAGLMISEPTQLRLLGRPGEAAILEQKLNMKVEVSSKWDYPDLQRNWDKFLMENKALAENAGAELALVIYNAMWNIAKLPESDLKATLEESLGYVMRAISEPGSVPATVLNTALADLIDAEYISAEWANRIRDAASGAVSGLSDIIVDRSKYIESLFAQIGEQAGNALADGLLTVQEQETIIKLVEEFQKAGGDASQALIQAILAQNWEEVGRIVGQRTGASIKSELFGELQGALAPTLEQILKDPKLEQSIMYPSLFIKNTFQPALKRDFEQMNELYKSGLAENVDIVKNWADNLVSVYTDHAAWFRDWQAYLLDLYSDHQISLSQLMEMWAYAEGMLERQATSTKNASVGYDQLSKAVKECNECMSDFGNWQEANADKLFAGSYIGRGGAEYLQWKADQIRAIRETQEAMDRVGGAVVGRRYTGEEYAWVERPVTLEAKLQVDNTEANAAVEATKAVWSMLKGELTSPENKISVDPSGAIASIQSLIGYIDANRYQTIYVETVYTETYGGSSAQELAASAAASLWGRIQGYQSGTDYVPETGLYLLHRGEAVVPAEENRSGGRAGATFVFNTYTYISGEVGDPEAWRTELDRRDELLRREFREADMRLARAR